MKDQESPGVLANIDSSPFQETVTVDYFFGDGRRREIITDMLHAIAGLIPIVVLTGEEGSGKTMMCRVLKDEVPPNCIPVFFPQTVESFEDVVRILAKEVGLSAASTSKADVSALLEGVGSQLTERNERLIVIFDQAEQIYLATLERIRKMLDRINESGVVMQVVLAGRSVLTDNLNQLSICNFADAEEKHYTLESLSAEETSAYLRHASGLLAGEELLEFFTPEISGKIYNAARGNFRMTNILAEEALKNQARDASFWVLLENVENNDQTEISKGAKKRSLPDLSRVSSRLLTYFGGAVCAGLLLLWYLTGNEQQADSTPEETVAMVQSAEQVVVATGSAVSAQKTDLPPKKQDISGETTVSSPAAPERITTEQPAPSFSNIVISSLTQSESDEGEIDREREAVQGDGEEATELTETVVEQGTEPEQVAVTGPPVSDRLSITETGDREEQITEIRQTRPVKVKVDQLKQIEKTREKIKVPVVAQVIVPEEQVDEIDLIYNRRVAAGRPWLSGQNHNLYTVQLMVLTSETAEENFKKMLRQKNYRQEAHNFYIFQKEGAPLTLLVFYGEYATMTDARNARNNIPVFLRGHKPYAISVQGAMRKVELE